MTGTCVIVVLLHLYLPKHRVTHQYQSVKQAMFLDVDAVVVVRSFRVFLEMQ